MAYCTKCGAEYRESATDCADCTIPLIRSRYKSENSITCFLCGIQNPDDAKYCYDCGGYLQAIDLGSVPLSLQGEKMQCYSCGNDTPLGSEFCIFCGYILTGNQSCNNHPERKTRHVCLVCKKPVCKKCSAKIDERFFCHEHSDYHFVGHWAAVHAADIESELEPVKGALESNKIYVVTGSSGAKHRGAAHGLFSAAIDPISTGRFNLLVPIVQLQEAENILIESGFVFENVCDSCGHEFNGDPVRCPQCGEEFI